MRVGDTDLCAPRANRLIFTHDPPAETLRISDELGTALAETTRIFLVSSLNAIRDGRVLETRLAQLRQYMDRLPSDAFVYYEDAGFHDPALSKQAVDGLRGAVDVHGMNEDGMQVHLGHHVDLLDADAMAEALTELHPLVAAPIVVVHTRYWVLSLGSDAQRYEPALRSGITMATSRYLHGDALPGADSGVHDPSTRQVRGSPRSPRPVGRCGVLRSRGACQRPRKPDDDRSRRHLRRWVPRPLVAAGA